MVDLRALARELFVAACDAANPATALRQAVVHTPPRHPRPGGRYIVVSIGKAALPMAQEMLSILDDENADAVVVTTYENAGILKGHQVLGTGHPVPDESGLAAGSKIVDLLKNAREKDVVIALVSGGASALVPTPVNGISLDDKKQLTEQLLLGGFDIWEINLVRPYLSVLKGGGFARLASPAPVCAYILSDVVGDDLRVVASGMTVGPAGTRSDAIDLLKRKGIWKNLPQNIREVLQQGGPESGPAENVRNTLIGSNGHSLEAIAEQSAAAGFAPSILNRNLTGDVQSAARSIVDAINGRDADGTACFIFGGETTVHVTGSGRGGRNQELALRVAAAMPDQASDWVFLSGGTDGIDGLTDAAGGIVDARTITRIRSAGGDPQALLDNNDSNAALRLSGDLLCTGPTGTNVADVQILLVQPG